MSHNQETKRYVIGGPKGDYTVNATDNPSGGVVEKGWPTGKRAGYADDVWIYDTNGDGIELTDIQPLDNEWAIGFYTAFGTLYEDYPDINNYNSDPRYLMMALLRRDGDTLLTVQKDVVLDVYESLTDRQGLTSTRLSSTDVAVGYCAFAPDPIDPYYGPGVPAVSVVRRVGETLEVVAIELLWDDDTIWYWGWFFEFAVPDIVRLSDDRFVALYSDIYDPGNPVLTHSGELSPSSEDHGVSAVVCQRQGGSIVKGERALIATYEGDNPTGFAVHENRIVVFNSWESRPELKNRLALGTEGYHDITGHIRTYDIDGLTLTENIDNGLLMVGYDIEWMYAQCPKIFMVNPSEGVLLYTMEADIQPPLAWSGSDSGGSTTQWVQEPELRATYRDKRTHDGRGNTYVRPPTIPMALRFEVGQDGSVSTPWIPHVLDASPVSGRNVTKPPSQAALYNIFEGFSGEMVNGHVLAQWTHYNPTPLPRGWTDVLNVANAARATWLVMDDDSESGIRPSGYRHLGIAQYQNYDNVRVQIKNFPGSEWFTASTGWVTDYLVDGPGLSPEYYPGFPAHDMDLYPRYFWPEYSGYSPVVVYGVYQGPPTYETIYYRVPNTELLAYDEWDYDAYKYPWLPETKYGNKPWWQDHPDYLIKEPRIVDPVLGEIWPNDTAQFHLWRISPPPNAVAQVEDVQVYAAKRSSSGF